MSDFPGSETHVTPLHIHTYSYASAQREVWAMSGLAGNGSVAWGTANMAVYISMVIPYPYPVRRVFWLNGTTLTSTSADFGIYTRDGERLYHTGSTVLSGTGTSQTQYTTLATPILLTPGTYYFAYATNNTTSCVQANTEYPAHPEWTRLGGLLQQATAFPLPEKMTPEAVTTGAFTPLCGITRTATGF